MSDDTRFASVLRAILPEGIAVVGRANACVDLAMDQERALTTEMVDSRREEFLTGRTCARLALRQLGLPDRPLLRGEDRAPKWPTAVAGSISHCAGACVAAVGSGAAYFGIGVDVERRNAVASELQRLVATPAEIARFSDGEDWGTLAFSAKESVFKCINPPTGIWLEFHDVELLTVGKSSFRAKVCASGRPEFRVEGTHARTEEFVVTAVAIAVDDPLAAGLGGS